MKQRIVVSVLLVLVGVVIGALIIYVSVLNKDTSVQKNSIMKQSSDVKNAENITSIYRNVQYGFEFQYPQDWLIEENSENFQLMPKERKNCGPNINPTIEELMCLDSIVLDTFQNEDRLTMQKYLDKNMWVKGQDYDDLSEKKVGKKLLYELTMISAHDGSRNRSVWIPLDDGDFFTIQESYLLDEEKKVFDQIIRTLRFTQ